MVLAAVKQNGSAIEYVSEELGKDKDVIKTKRNSDKKR